MAQSSVILLQGARKSDLNLSVPEMSVNVQQCPGHIYDIVMMSKKIKQNRQEPS